MKLVERNNYENEWWTGRDSNSGPLPFWEVRLCVIAANDNDEVARWAFPFLRESVRISQRIPYYRSRPSKGLLPIQVDSIRMLTVPALEWLSRL